MSKIYKIEMKKKKIEMKNKKKKHSKFCFMKRVQVDMATFHMQIYEVTLKW